MRISSTVLIIVALCAATPARSDVFVISLPELQGTYPHYASPTVSGRTATIHMPGIPAVVRGASLHLVGTTEVGTVYCDDTPGSQYPWTTGTTTYMLDGPQKYWLSESENPSVAGPFDTNKPFFRYTPSGPQPTWNFLLDGEDTIHLDGGPGPTLLGCSTSNPPPTFTVTGAWIEVDADIPTPAAPTSWGAVKATYR